MKIRANFIKDGKPLVSSSPKPNYQKTTKDFYTFISFILLPILMFGELRIREAEKAVEELV